MFNSSILEVAMGMIFLYVLISLFCSAIKEMISQLLKLRAKNLEAGLTNLLASGEGNQLVTALYNHPLIRGLSKTGKKPSYIPAKHFTLALMDVMSGKNETSTTDTEALLKNLKESRFAHTDAGKSVILLIQDAGNDAVRARQNLENWFNDAMDRAGGWYKRTAQNIIFVVALVVCATLNIDSIKIAQTLWTDKTIRELVVATATTQNNVLQSMIAANTKENNGNNTQTANSDLIANLKTLTENAAKPLDQIKDLKLPIGWHDKDNSRINEDFTANDWLLNFIGILVTTFAASLGAPFWFQLLNKVADLRSAGKQPVSHDNLPKKEGSS